MADYEAKMIRDLGIEDAFGEGAAQLSEAATAALRELAISGPGTPGPEEMEELIAHGLAVRVLKITPAGELVAERIPDFRRMQMQDAIKRAKAAVASMEEHERSLPEIVAEGE